VRKKERRDASEKGTTLIANMDNLDNSEGLDEGTDNGSAAQG